MGDEPTTLPITCTLSPCDMADRGRELANTLFAGVEEVRELADGYAFRFPADGDWLPRLAGFVDAERRCCAFFRFEIGVEPNHGPLWLRLRGGEGVKEFVTAMFVPATAGTAS